MVNIETPFPETRGTRCDTQKNIIFWSSSSLCCSRLQNSDFCFISKNTGEPDLKQELHPGPPWLLLSGVCPAGEKARLSSAQLCSLCKISMHLQLGWVIREQTGDSGSMMCKFMPLGTRRGRKSNTSVHSTWVGKATMAGMKSAAFSCQAWCLDALISWFRVPSLEAHTHIPRPWGPHTWP